MALCAGLKNSDAFVTSDGYVLQDADGLYLSILSVVDKRKIIINNVAYRVMVDFNLKPNNLNLKEGE